MTESIGVPVELDRLRTLRLGINAMCEIEQVLQSKRGDKVSIDAVLTGALSLATLRTVFWAGLKHEDEDLAKKDWREGEIEAGKIIEEALDKGTTIADLSDAMSEALKWAFPESEDWRLNVVAKIQEAAQLVPDGEEKVGASLLAVIKAIAPPEEEDEAKGPTPSESGPGDASPSLTVSAT